MKQIYQDFCRYKRMKQIYQDLIALAIIALVWLCFFLAGFR